LNEILVVRERRETVFENVINEPNVHTYAVTFLHVQKQIGTGFFKFI